MAERTGAGEEKKASSLPSMKGKGETPTRAHKKETKRKEASDWIWPPFGRKEKIVERRERKERKERLSLVVPHTQRSCSSKKVYYIREGEKKDPTM